MNYSSFELNDKVAVVTGASQGIGRAIALGLAEAGAHLVLAKHPGPRMAEIEEVAAQIEGMGRRAIIVLTDVAVVAEVQALMDKTVAELIRLLDDSPLETRRDAAPTLASLRQRVGIHVNRPFS